MKSLVKWWKSEPKVRTAVRTLAVAATAYLAPIILGQSEWTTWGDLGRALVAAAIYGGLALGTPLEPFVGFFKPKGIEVPVPPAVPEK